jgi:hypothetical protein
VDQCEGAKEKNVPADEHEQFGIGGVWTSTALAADVGRRDADADKISSTKGVGTLAHIDAIALTVNYC